MQGEREVSTNLRKKGENEGKSRVKLGKWSLLKCCIYHEGEVIAVYLKYEVKKVQEPTKAIM